MSENDDCCERAISEALGELQSNVEGLTSGVTITSGTIIREEITANDDGSITTLRTAVGSDGGQWHISYTRRDNLRDFDRFSVHRLKG